MSSRSSPPPPLRSRRSSPSPPRRPVDVRHALLGIFLPIAAALALPSLGMGALIWWRASKTWDYRERWSGTWLMAIVGLLVYGFVSWFYHPLPSLFHTLTVYLSHFPTEPRSLVTGLRWLGILWLLHLCFAPSCALILEALHPLTRRALLLPRDSAREPGTARADGFASLATQARSFQDIRWQKTPAHAGQTLASSALSPAPITAAGRLSAGQASPLEPLGAYLCGELDEWVYGGQLCIPAEALALHGVVLGEPGFGKTITLLRLATIAARYGMQGSRRTLRYHHRHRQHRDGRGQRARVRARRRRRLPRRRGRSVLELLKQRLPCPYHQRSHRNREGAQRRTNRGQSSKKTIALSTFKAWRVWSENT
jgi:hypothetical protein